MKGPFFILPAFLSLFSLDLFAKPNIEASAVASIAFSGSNGFLGAQGASYGFAGLCVMLAIATLFVRDTARALLALIGTFLGAAALCLTLKAEFLGLVIIALYVGAVAVLFLFVMLLLGGRSAFQVEGVADKSAPYFSTYGLGGISASFILALLLLALTMRIPLAPLGRFMDISPVLITQLAQVLYGPLSCGLLLSGGVLLAAMWGSILLLSEPMRSLKKEKREQLRSHLAHGLKGPEKGCELIDLPLYTGLDGVSPQDAAERVSQQRGGQPSDFSKKEDLQNEDDTQNKDNTQNKGGG